MIAARNAVVAAAESWLGTPYHHRAMVKGAGADCGMILIAVFAEAGLIEPFDPGYYPRDWMLHREEERYLGIVKKFAHPVAEPKPGDIVLFQFGRCISHGAIVVEWPMVIHAYQPAGCVVLENVLANPNLFERIAAYYSVWSAAE